MEWMTLWRWMTTSTFSGGTPNSRMASMYSRPLFIRVAQSTVIFSPMVQLGWRRASARVFPAISPRVRPKKGPPEQVSSRRRTSPRSRQPWRHWKMAECSLSTGTISTPRRRAAAITSSPAQTRVSLLARATRLPASMAARVGRRPTIPTTAVTTVSLSGRDAASSRPSIPQAARMFKSDSRSLRARASSRSQSTTRRGRNCLACRSSRSIFRRAVRASTRTPSRAQTSRVCRPMEPVEPRSEMDGTIDHILRDLLILIVCKALILYSLKSWSSTSSVGAAKITLSNRSKTPPWARKICP